MIHVWNPLRVEQCFNPALRLPWETIGFSLRGARGYQQNYLGG